MNSQHRSTKDLAWAAGFLEGEGWFGKRNTTSGTPRIVAAQVNRAPIDKLVTLFGGNVRLQKPRKPNVQPVWYWELSGSLAVGVMLTLFTMLSAVRQQQIVTALLKWRKGSARAPKGYGLRNPNSPLYCGTNGRWK